MRVGVKVAWPGCAARGRWRTTYYLLQVKQREGRWRMLRLPKGAPMEEKGGGSEYTYMVIKHAMISRTCRDVVADLEPDLAEVIYSYAPKAGWSAKELGAAYCAATCTGGAKDEL